MFLGVVLLFFSFIYGYYGITLYRCVQHVFVFINAFKYRIARMGVQQFLILQRFLSLSSDGTRDKFFLGAPLGTTLIGVLFQEPRLYMGFLQGTTFIGVLFNEPLV